MQNEKTATFWRHDTFLGVCEAIGQDFGFNANWLRLAFSAALLASPKIVLMVYLCMGAVVLASRLLFPARRDTGTIDAAPVAIAQNAREVAELPLAA